MKIIELWLCGQFNVKKIANKLEEIYKIEHIDNRFIYVFIDSCLKIIAIYISSIYTLDQLSGKY